MSAYVDYWRQRMRETGRDGRDESGRMCPENVDAMAADIVEELVDGYDAYFEATGNPDPAGTGPNANPIKAGTPLPLADDHADFEALCDRVAAECRKRGELPATIEPYPTDCGTGLAADGGEQ